jgi:mono/diheme cytochrome c family protein
VSRSLTCLGSIIALAIGATALRAQGVDFFESKIRPILVESCYECHSEAKGKHRGGLQLDSKEGLLKGGDTGPAIVANDPGKSLLMRAVRWETDDLKMPPKRKLTDEQIADLDAWIKAGAPDPRSGRKPRTQIEQHLADAKSHWAFQPIVDPHPTSLDDLVAAKPGPATDRRTLIRRAYFDLIGLPPTFEEVKDFALDKSPKAFEKLIDKLLADPRYGERWGRHWLDVARYADNMGSIFNGDDSYPNAFTYRDYVIRSFNEDKPYDRFLLEQIAADQIDAAKDPQTLAAMGFLGLGRRKDRQFDDDTIDDTTDVIGRGLLGLTIGCARCHDHKLEPITTTDYYGLYAVLRSSKEPKVPPALPQIESAKTRDYAEKNRKARADFASASIKAASTVSSQARSRVGDYLLLAQETGWKTTNELKTVKDLVSQRKLEPELHNAVARSRKGWVDSHPDVFGPWLDLSAKKPIATDKLHPLVAKVLGPTPPAALEDLAKRYNKLFADIDGEWRKLVATEMAKAPLLTNEDLESLLPTLQLHAIAQLEELETKLPLPDSARESLRQVLASTGSPMRIGPDRYVSAGLFDAATKKSFEKLQNAVNDLEKHEGAPPRPMAFFDADKIYDGKVFVRGNPRTLGADAPRRFLTVLSDISSQPFPKDKSGRLEFAQAVVHKDNPLTARVIANRVWLWHFGEALVGTPSDFGFRGDHPANPKLLDHLAGWFMENGWSFKKLHKHLMLTDYYQRRDFSMRPLELEPFRDSLLAVTGRLSPESFGRPSKVQETTRRTVYAFVDRKTLPALYRSFDFPDPNFTASRRSNTALTPRALILLNSPLVTESAKTLASALLKASVDPTRQIEELYRGVLQRDPSAKELHRAVDYLAGYPQKDLVHPEEKDWQYGYGSFDAEAKLVKGFTPLTTFDGKAWRGTPKTPDGKASTIMLDAMGGTSGAGEAVSSIRRWIAPIDGQIEISGELVPMDAKSEGIAARIVSSRTGLIGEWNVKMQSMNTEVKKHAVKKGEVLDFLVAHRSGNGSGSYRWSPTILMPTANMPGMPGMAKRWDARTDFGNPNNPANPLTALEELVQTLLLSPEFASLE